MMRQATERDSAARRTLREVTMAAHERLHVHPRLEPLLSPALRRDQYIDALKGLFGFHAAMERVLATTPSRAGMIHRDLHNLGMPEDQVADLPEADTLPAPADEPTKLGYRYVVVGSYVGGKVIAANIARTLGAGPETGCAFFAGDSADVGNLWRTLLADLDRTLTTDELRQAAAQGALTAFEALEAWLDQDAVSERVPSS